MKKYIFAIAVLLFGAVSLVSAQSSGQKEIAITPNTWVMCPEGWAMVGGHVTRFDVNNKYLTKIVCTEVSGHMIGNVTEINTFDSGNYGYLNCPDGNLVRGVWSSVTVTPRLNLGGHLTKIACQKPKLQGPLNYEKIRIVDDLMTYCPGGRGVQQILVEKYSDTNKTEREFGCDDWGIPAATPPPPSVTPPPAGNPYIPPYKGTLGIGDKVQIWQSGVNFRAAPAGTQIGVRQIGDIGTISDGPQWAILNGEGYYWWKVNFAAPGVASTWADVGWVYNYPLKKEVERPPISCKSGSFCSRNGVTIDTKCECGVPSGTGWVDQGAGCYHKSTGASCTFTPTPTPPPPPPVLCPALVVPTSITQPSGTEGECFVPCTGGGICQFGGGGCWRGLSVNAEGQAIKEARFSSSCVTEKPSGWTPRPQSACGVSSGVGPSLIFTATPGAINYGNYTTLTWDSDDDAQCTAIGGIVAWSGDAPAYGQRKETSGSYRFNPAISATYGLRCRTFNGETIGRACVNVVNPAVTSTKFSVNDRVEPTSARVTVRNAPAGTEVTKLSSGYFGTVKGGPTWASLAGDRGRWWWQVDFDPQGVSVSDGWVAEAYLRKPYVAIACPNTWTPTTGGSYDRDREGSYCGCDNWLANGEYEGTFSPSPRAECSPTSTAPIPLPGTLPPPPPPPPPSGPPPPPPPPPSLVPIGPNLIENPGFEIAGSGGTGVISGWLNDSYTSQVGIFSLDTSIKKAGVSSAKIFLTAQNDSRFSRSVTLEVGSDYRFSGWIKTDSVVGRTGMMITDAGLQEKLLLGPYRDTRDWTFVERDFKATAEMQKVAVRLGGFGDVSTGTVWFDDLSLYKLSTDGSVAPIALQPNDCVRTKRTLYVRRDGVSQSPPVTIKPNPQPVGATGKLKSRSTAIVENYWRWDIDYTTGPDGWSAEGDGSDMYLEKIACPTVSDTTAPLIDIFSPILTNNATTTSKNNLPVLVASTTDAGSGIYGKTVIWSSSPNGATGRMTPGYGWVASQIPLNPGVNTITITAIDSAGNTGTKSFTVTSTYGSAAPIALQPNDCVMATQLLRPRTGEDMASPYAAGVPFPQPIGATGKLISKSINLYGGYPRWIVDFTTGPDGWIEQGWHSSVYLEKITCPAGSQANSRAIDRDTTPPVITIVSPALNANNSFTTNQIKLSLLAASITDAGGINASTVIWTNSATGKTGKLIQGYGWIATGIDLIRGANTITVEAIDSAGNTGTKSFTVISAATAMAGDNEAEALANTLQGLRDTLMGLQSIISR